MSHFFDRFSSFPTDVSASSLQMFLNRLQNTLHVYRVRYASLSSAYYLANKKCKFLRDWLAGRSASPTWIVKLADVDLYTRWMSEMGQTIPDRTQHQMLTQCQARIDHIILSRRLSQRQLVEVYGDGNCMIYSVCQWPAQQHCVRYEQEAREFRRQLARFIRENVEALRDQWMQWLQSAEEVRSKLSASEKVAHDHAVQVTLGFDEVEPAELAAAQDTFAITTANAFERGRTFGSLSVLYAYTLWQQRAIVVVQRRSENPLEPYKVVSILPNIRTFETTLDRDVLYLEHTIIPRTDTDGYIEHWRFFANAEASADTNTDDDDDMDTKNADEPP